MTIVKFVDTNAENHPDKLALCDMETEFTFQEVKDKREQAAAPPAIPRDAFIPIKVSYPPESPGPKV